MSLRDGKSKMSKSDESEYSRINLQASEDEIIKKIKKAKTDSEPIPSKIEDLKSRPEALNLINIYSFITDKTLENTFASMAGKDFSKLKKELSDVLVATICPIGKKIKELKKDEKYLIDILKKGSNKAKEIAKININKVKDIVGFISH